LFTSFSSQQTHKNVDEKAQITTENRQNKGANSTHLAFISTDAAITKINTPIPHILIDFEGKLSPIS
jgi:hypothetical protein